MNSRVAIIPARGGSKRLHNKNIVDFDGKPLIAHTIEAAIESELFEDVIVSTDSEQIAEVAVKFGAQVPFLRQTAADDYAPVSEATIDCLNQLSEAGETYERVVQLFAVCPLRTAQDIQIADTFFTKNKLDFLISAFRYVGANPWWAVTLENDGTPKRIFENTYQRSQDLPTLFCPTGAIWMANVSKLLEQGTFYGEGHRYWEIDWKRGIDIDDMDDVILAKALKTTL